MSQNSLVISALGKDRPGLVDEFTRCILDHQGNIADSRMTVLGGHFAIILLVDGPWNQIAKLEDQLPVTGEQLGLTVTTQRTESDQPAALSLPYAVEVIALDNPGIVHRLANFFSSRTINIQDLVTDSYAAAHTGTPMFNVHMRVNIPADRHIASLREEFMDFCDQHNLDAVIEPVKL